MTDRSDEIAAKFGLKLPCPADDAFTAMGERILQLEQRIDELMAQTYKPYNLDDPLTSVLPEHDIAWRVLDRMNDEPPKDDKP